MRRTRLVRLAITGAAAALTLATLLDWRAWP